MDFRTNVLNIMGKLGIDTTSLSDETRLKEDLDMDSTEFIELALAVEKQLSIPVEDSSFMALTTFGEVVNYLNARTPLAVEGKRSAVHAASSA